MSELTPSDPAYDRYSALIASLHDMPLSNFEKGLLSRLVAWTAADEIRALVRVIERVQEYAVEQYKARRDAEDADPTS